MNICFLLGGFTGAGGIGRVGSLLINKLAKNNSSNLNLFVLTYSNNDQPIYYSLDEKVHHSYLFNEPINMKNGLAKGGIKKLRSYLKEHKIDILIACGSLYYILGVLATRKLKTKCICWEHSNALQNDEFPLQNFSRRLANHYADFIITLNKEDRSNYEKKFNSKKIKHIYNPIDDSIYQYSGNYNLKSKKIISVGRLSDQKNFDSLVEVAREVFKTHSDWTWDIYGEGELREELEKKIALYNLNDKVILKGAVPNLYELYSQYAFLVMTSKYEGFPMTLLEAIAFDLPLISFDIHTGPNEIIEDGLNGYLIPAFDKDKMVSKINFLIENQELRKDFSQANDKIRHTFEIDVIIQEWLDLFQLVYQG